MGNNTAADLANGIEEGWASPRQALAVHLQSNHWPPLPLTFVDVAQDVITKANAGEWDARVTWPTASAEPLPREARREEDGTFTTSVSVAVGILHLFAFIDNEEV